MAFRVPGFQVRAPLREELEVVLGIYNSFDIPKYGRPNQSLESILSIWNSPGFHLETDAWMVTTPGGQAIGYVHVWSDDHTHFVTNGGVHPAYCQQGIGTALLRLAAARVREHLPQAAAEARVTLATWSLNTAANDAEHRLLQREGYQAIRHAWEMRIDMQEAPPEPAWPAGVTLRTFVPRQDEWGLFEAFSEAFQDHWGYTPLPFGTWAYETVAQETFDPSLCFLACEGETIAGFSICEDSSLIESGRVNDLGIRHAWRKQGVGRALLLHSFRMFYQRGRRGVQLSVDSQSLTGATRLYEQAGMHVTLQQDWYEKELRTGKELRTQSLGE